MWIGTHYYMAKQVHAYIKNKYQCDLRLDLLEYGSIMPDLHWKYLSIPHYYEDENGYWLQEVRQLLADKKYRDIKEFSVKLGVILHFAADYFCYAHNTQELKENMWSHIKYEVKLHQAFIQHGELQNKIVFPCGDATILLKNLRHKYLQTEPSLENDIQFIYTVSLAIADLMVIAVLYPSVHVA